MISLRRARFSLSLFSAPSLVTLARVGACLLGCLAMFPFASTSLDTDDTIDLSSNPIHPAEVRLYDELAVWVGEPSVDPFPQDQNLTDSVSQRQASFDIFRSAAGVSVRNELARERPFGALITNVARTEGLDPLLLVAMIEVESSYDPQAVSSQGALGLMQVMPATAEEFGVEHPIDPIRGSLTAGARYLRWLQEYFEGDLTIALAAYNAGPGAVQRYEGIPPYRETVLYVERVLEKYLALTRTAWESEEQLEPWTLALPAG